MKLSVSLPEDDVEFLDTYAAAQGIESRSAAVQKAIQLLRASELGALYEAAWNEWTDSDEASGWDATAADGLADAAR
jgi:Arc/MetJ-type ribon-helix-helix transcriptional regulator